MIYDMSCINETGPRLCQTTTLLRHLLPFSSSSAFCFFGSGYYYYYTLFGPAFSSVPRRND